MESQLDQVGNMSGFGVGGGCRHGHNVLDNAKGSGPFLFYQRVLDAVGFKLMGEAFVQFGVGLSVWRLYQVGEDIQEVGCQNRPPCLRNGLVSKSAQASRGVVGTLDPVSV